MLQARIFASADSHRYRLGAHCGALPVNAPRCRVHHYPTDGAMRVTPNMLHGVAYDEPNAFDDPAPASAYREPLLKRSGDRDRHDHRVGNDDDGQPRALFRLLGAAQQQRLVADIAAAMGRLPRAIVDRRLAHFDKIDPACGAGVRKALDIG
ncbi:MAG: catalase [Alphaproteobacteria bacterium]|nr:catalase [Alphaproteobacteria bacterium]